MTEFFLKTILAQELFDNRLCESLEDQQIVDLFYHELLLEKFLFGEPLTIPELRKLLRQKILNFEFIKLDGEVRPATGTTMMKYIPKKDHPKGIRPSSPKVATFFDLDKIAWRSVSQRSKEIVLKKDEEKGRPIVVVRDVDKEVTKVPKEERPEKPVDVTDIKPEYEEPIDELKVGDVRNYLNRYDKNIQVEIIRIGDDGSVYARTTADNALFKVPEARLKNIGEIISKDQVQRGRKKILTTQPISPTTPPPPKEEERPTTILLPKEEIESKEPPKPLPPEEELGAEEL
jgi:hypothetical protein